MMEPRKITTSSYHVQSTAQVSRDGFPYFDWHESVSALWAQKWRRSCTAGIYPFSEGEVADFDPIFAELTDLSGDDPAILSQPDNYAAPFMPVGERLTGEAEDAKASGDDDRARNLFLRAAAVYRIARFPIPRSPLGRRAWELGKAAYEKGGELLDPPNASVSMTFSKADAPAGDDDADIRAYLRMPKGDKPEAGWPVLLLMCGLDGFRTDQTPVVQAHVDRGFATLTFEIPGTGDCPAAPDDPTAPDRLMASVLDWVAESATRLGFDTGKVVLRGLSTGGYYAFRAAHTHADRLFAAVAQGGGCHHMFDPRWIAAQNQMEYPFAAAEGLAYKWGFRDADPAAAVARYAAEGSKFSLVESGIVGTPTCRLLVINGMEDTIFPIEDSILVAAQGDKKDLVVLGNRSHMGDPGAEDIVSRWIDDVVAGRP